MTKGILDGLKGSLDSILALRDTLGVALAEVSLVERRWSGANIGDGIKTDTVKKMWPSPQIVDLSQDIRLMDGGSVRRGDLILKSISKNQYGREALLNETDASNVELLYMVGSHPYKAVSLKEEHLTWSVHIRPQSGV